jgi:hypothetical protein
MKLAIYTSRTSASDEKHKKTPTIIIRTPQKNNNKKITPP